jgi:hypothetical protein
MSKSASIETTRVPTVMIESAEATVEVGISSSDEGPQTHKSLFRVCCCVEVEYAGGPIIGQIETQIWNRSFGVWKKVKQEFLDNQLRGNPDLTKLVSAVRSSLEDRRSARIRKFRTPDTSWANDRVLLD